MSKQSNRQHKPAVNKARDPIAEYIAALEEFYPPAIGTAEVIKRKDNRVIVSIPFPSRVSDRMRLFDHMAEIGTKLLIETDEYIILSWQ